jgi:hypothetical protein
MTGPKRTAWGVVLALALLIPRGTPAGLPPAPWDPVFAGSTTVADFGASARPFGLAVGDFDGDGLVDLVAGRVSGHTALIKGNGDGTFAAPVDFAWKLAFFNAWAFAAADVDGDDVLDVVWGANATSSGCSVSPEPVGGCGTEGSEVVTVEDGELRVLYGNGDGTFDETPYFISGVRHNAGSLIADLGVDAGSLAVGDMDGDNLDDIVAGAIDGANTVVRILLNQGGSVFSVETVVSQPATGSLASPIYWPAISTQNSPWGLSLSDADDDMDLDLWVADRALYVYLFLNDGIGNFTLVTPNTAVAGRPNVYLGHDAVRAAVGYTASLGSGDINGDGEADLILGLHSGTQNPDSAVVHDGELVLDASAGGAHINAGNLGDLGTMARGVTAVDINDDTYLDLVAGVYEGQVKLLRQLMPLDTDDDGISDYVDNAPSMANAPRLDMNADGSLDYRDQLDNDFDTVLGDPEDMGTWVRLGDPADDDDDNDTTLDVADNCPFAANALQENIDGDGLGDACDPLDDSDPDADGIPTGPQSGDALYDAALAARLKWQQGDTRFVLRIDALSRFFQNEFTQIQTDAATLSPAEWESGCWQNYDPGDISGDPTYEPCGVDEGLPSQTLTLDGGRQVPISLVVIPKQLWTDPPVVTWINERNDHALLEIGQHGSYHFNNTPVSDWKDDPSLDFYACEVCGLSLAENLELMRIGYDTLVGNYTNKWVAESGATPSSPSIDWSSSANPLISYAPPFNASDTLGREGVARLGFRSYSASIFEETSTDFTPEGSHHEQFDQFGMFHSSADRQVNPPDIVNDTYNPAAYEAYLQSITQDGELNTWLIEEVEWSGRACNDLPRLVDCNGSSNREDNTVYLPRWQAWLQLLDYLNSYPGGVTMTLGEVALASGFDNCADDANADQLDTDSDGQGDVCDLDDDNDGVADAADCAPLDAGSFAEPDDVTGLTFTEIDGSFTWDSLAPSAGVATTYDVLRGGLDQLPVGSGGSEACLESGLVAPGWVDGEDPSSGSGYWYLVRGANACAVGPYGEESDGTPRASAACP